MVASVTDIDALRSRLDAEAARMTIELRPGELASAVKESEAALIDADAGIYQRGGQLVRVAQLDAHSRQGGIHRAMGTPVIMPVSRDYLLLQLSTHANFSRYNSRKKAMSPADPPGAVANMLLSAVGEWKFPELRGIVSAPTLRPDGSLLIQPGYDPASRLLLWNDGTEWPKINERPTVADADAALAVLKDLLAEFEFAGGPDGPSSAAAIAAILTACMRYALPIAPGYGLNAHKAGSGKTTLGHTIARIPTGRDAAVMPLAEEENEVRKALFAVLLAGDSTVVIDNISAPVDSSAVCAALTSATYKDRILGESRTVSLPTAVTMVFNGNNLEFVGDLTSRIILSTLDPQCERPESRSFRRDIAAYVGEHRPDLVRAALTIPLAYRAAALPNCGATPSRFTAWDKFVRYPLLWLGMADPLDTQAELRGTDPIRGALVAVMSAWREVFAERPTTVAQAVDAATAPGMSANPRLLEALLEIAGERNGTVNSRRLGRWMVKHLRRIENGDRIEDAGTDPITSRRRFRVSSVISVSANPIVDVRSAKTIGGYGTNAGNADNADGDTQW